MSGGGAERSRLMLGGHSTGRLLLFLSLAVFTNPQMDQKACLDDVLLTGPSYVFSLLSRLPPFLCAVGSLRSILIPLPWSWFRDAFVQVIAARPRSSAG